MLKQVARQINIRISWSLAHRYIKRHRPVIIGVVGSVGKTGTKRAIAHIVSQGKRVAWQDGNYNDLVTVPLVFFGESEPTLYNPLAWAKTWLRMLKKLSTNQPAEVAVLELGTDGPGQIAAFGKYLKLDIAVVTAISHEHMEYFGSLEAVAKEELAVIDFADKFYVASQAMNFIPNPPANLQTYGENEANDIWFGLQADVLKVHLEQAVISARPQLSGDHQYAALAVAADIALEVGLTSAKITTGIESLASMPGRMNVLAGKDNSLLVDDTYNSSPDAVVKALEFLYGLPNKKKIAVLGNMNEMGGHSAELHREVAKACDPKKLELVITIGQDANHILAPAVAEQGCRVERFDSPYEIGKFLNQQKLTNRAILFKGSQNGVFLEEAVKAVLADPADSSRLVRQSDYWMRRKQKQFAVE